MQVSGGQPGVFYHFRSDPGGTDIALPAYFHKRDEADDRFNKGLGQLAIEVDLAIAADPPPGGPSVAHQPRRDPPRAAHPRPGSPQPGRDAPRPRRQGADPSRGRSRQDAQIPSLPEIRPEQSPVDYGAKASLRVIASRVGRDLSAAVQSGSPLRMPNPATGRTSPSRPRPRPTTRPSRCTSSARPTLGSPSSASSTCRWPCGPGPIWPSPRPRRPSTRVVRRWCGSTPANPACSRPAQRRRSAGGRIGDRQRGLAVVAHRPDRADTTFVVRAARTSDPAIAVALNQKAVVTVRPIDASSLSHRPIPARPPNPRAEMREDPHQVRRLVIELTIPPREDAARLQEQLGRLCRNRVVPLLDRCCSARCGPERLVRIESLEIDLGLLSPESPDDDLVARIGVELDRRLGELIGPTRTRPITPKAAPRAATPWNCSSISPATATCPGGLTPRGLARWTMPSTTCFGMPPNRSQNR